MAISIYKSIENAARDGMTFWQWLKLQLDAKEWPVWLERHRQLQFEAQLEKFDTLKKKKSSKRFIVLDRWGWPEDGIRCKSFKLHDSQEEAAKCGMATLGRRKFQVSPWSIFCKTQICKTIERRIAVREKLNLFKKHKR